MPYDFPTNPATGIVVTVPDGSYRVWDGQKWRAAPSGASIYPPVSGYLPLIGGSISPGPLNIVNGNTLTLRTSPTQAQINYNAPNLLYEASTFTGTISGNTLTITSAVQGIIKVGHAIYWPANLIPGDTIVAGSGTTWTLANSWTVASASFSTNNKESVTQFRALPAVSGIIPTGGINNQAITGIQLGASLDDLKLTSQLGMDFLDISSLKTGPDYDGTRYGIRAELRVSDPCVLTSKQHVVGGFYITARGQGDTGGTAGPGNGVGNVFGGILTATNGSASGYWASVIGQEIDIGVVAPAHPESVIGMQIVHQAGHTQQGVYADIGFGLGDQGTVAKGWRVGVSVGGPNSQWPIDPNGIIWRSSYAPSTPWANGIPGAQAAGGFDLAQVDFTGMSDVGGGFAFRVDGAKIIPALGNPGGTFEAGAGEFSGTPTGAKIDTTFSQMTGTPAVVAGGSLWNVGDTLNDQWGNHIQVATLSGTAIATVTVLRRGWQKTPPTNPVAFTINAVGPGATLRLGTGATFNLTWTLNNTLALQPSGGTVQVGAGCIAANGSVATVLGSLGPVGSHTAVQEWIAIKNASGVTRYIPAF